MTPKDDGLQDTVKDEIAIALGQMIVQAGLLEYQLQNWSWNLMGVDEKRGLSITAGMTFTPMRRMVKNLARTVLNDEGSHLVGHFLKEMGKAMTKRNEYVHAAWIVLSTGQARLVTKTTTLHQVTTEELNELGSEFSRLQAHLVLLAAESRRKFHPG